jgi:hypothetical protein
MESSGGEGSGQIHGEHQGSQVGARLLLAGLLMDVIPYELARRLVEKREREGDLDTYRAEKQVIIRRDGSDIHRSFLIR